MNNDPQATIELRLRTMRMLWFGMFGSIVLYYVLTIFVGRSERAEPNNTLSLILLVVGLSTVAISFVIKNMLLKRAVEQQQLQQVQVAYIAALAFAEVPALLGMLDFFVTGHPHYYVLFIIGVLGQILHFPRREHLANASFKKPIS